MKIIYSLGIFSILLGIIVFLAKRNSRLRYELKQVDKELDTQKKIVSIFKDTTDKIESINDSLKQKNDELEMKIKESEYADVKESVDIANDVVDMFNNGMSDK